MKPLVPALLALALIPARLFAEPPARSWLAQGEQELFKDLDPDAAAKILDDARFAALRRADPDRHARWTAQAAELTGLAHLLRGDPDLHALAEGLCNWLSDDAIGFGANIPKFETWAAKRAAGRDKHGLSIAVFDWSTLSAKERAFLQARGGNEAAWETRQYSMRRYALFQWAQADLTEFSRGPVPKSRTELAAFSAEADRLELLMPERWQDILAARVQAETSVKEEERRQADVLGRAGKLGAGAVADPAKAFDGSVAKPPADLRLSPGPEASFSPEQNRLLADVLRTRLLQDVGDVPLGKRAQEFYRDHPLDISIAPLDAGELAAYDIATKKMIVGSRDLVDWTQTRGKTAADLLRSPELLDQFVMLVEPTFIHEAEHQRQDAWRSQQKGEDSIEGQKVEVEAMLTQAAFTLQKMIANPKYRAFLDSDKSEMVFEDLRLARSLQEDKEGFGGMIEHEYYPSKPSSEDLASDAISHRRAVAAMLEKELKARGAGAAPAPNVEQRIPDSLLPYAWKSFAANAPTAQLEKELARQRTVLLQTDDLYLVERKRHEALVDEMARQSRWMPPRDSVPTPRGTR